MSPVKIVWGLFAVALIVYGGYTVDLYVRSIRHKGESNTSQEIGAVGFILLGSGGLALLILMMSP